MVAVQAIARALAPSGILRAGINLSNFLLVSSRGPHGEPQGVAPDMAAHLARSLNVPLELVPYKNPGLLADAAERDEWDVGLIGAEPQRAAVIAFSQVRARRDRPTNAHATALRPTERLPPCRD